MTRPRKLLIALIAAIVATALAFYLGRFTSVGNAMARVSQRFGGPAVGGTPAMPRQVVRSEVPEVRVEEVARDLRIPWAIAFAPDGRMLFTERPGRVQVIRRRGERPRPYLDLQSVVHESESGLMGLALHPQFATTPYLYVMYTARTANGVVNRVSRFRDQGDAAAREEVLVDGIAAAPNHDGGAVAFGPDGMLYIGTGDAQHPPTAQDLTSFNGKVLRLTPDGKIPADNPFARSPVWAYGFRNVTALAWHSSTKELWAASHGPSGEFPGLRHRDCVYIVKKAANHGWPLVVGTTTRQDIVSPALYYPEAAVPPGGAMFYSGSLFPQFRNNYFLASLRAAHLQRVVVGDGNRITAIERWWPQKYGRLRALAQGPDGSIYFSTSTRDGRDPVYPGPGADFIFRIVPAS